jgi:hypothetical protein
VLPSSSPSETRSINGGGIQSPVAPNQGSPAAHATAARSAGDAARTTMESTVAGNVEEAVLSSLPTQLPSVSFLPSGHSHVGPQHIWENTRVVRADASIPQICWTVASDGSVHLDRAVGTCAPGPTLRTDRFECAKTI